MIIRLLIESYDTLQDSIKFAIYQLSIFISVSDLLYIRFLLLSVSSLPPTHPAMCLLVWSVTLSKAILIFRFLILCPFFNDNEIRVNHIYAEL